MSGVDVTVIVPCYNAEGTVGECLRGICQTTRTSLEVLAISDGSTDGSLDAMRAVAAEDGRIRVIEKANEGYGATVNRGIAEARGTYVAVAEADDFVLPHMYDALYELAEAYGMPDVAKSSYWRVCGSPGAERRYHCYYYGRVRPRRQPFTIEAAPALLCYHPSIWSALYRRDFLAAEGISLVEAPGGGWVDNPFVVRALCAARSIAYTDSAWYCYREEVEGSSTSTATAELAYRRWHERQDAIDELGVGDPGVLRANYEVAFKYVARALASGACDDEGVWEQTQVVLHRMDPAIACRMDSVPPAVKDAYERATGHAFERPGGLGHAAALAGEALWGLRNNGLGFVVESALGARGRS